MPAPLFLDSQFKAQIELLFFPSDGILGCHSCFETSYAFSQAFAQFWKFLRAKYQERNACDDQHVHRLEQSFEHEMSSSSRSLKAPRAIWMRSACSYGLVFWFSIRGTK